MRKSIKQLFKNLYKRCDCNCGKLIPVINKRGEPSRFYPYHHSKGPNNANFKGITYEDNKYELLYSPNHPFKDHKNRVRTHRLVLEKYLSEKYNMTIYILPYFDVHHIDGNTRNNDPLNLKILTRSQHSSLHFKKDMSNRRCLKCGSNKTIMEKRSNGKIYPHWYGNERYGFTCYYCKNNLINANI